MLTKKSYYIQLGLSIIFLNQIKMLEINSFKILYLKESSLVDLTKHYSILPVSVLHVLPNKFREKELIKKELETLNKFLKLFNTLFHRYGFRVFFWAGMIITDYRAQFYNFEIANDLIESLKYNNS